MLLESAAIMNWAIPFAGALVTPIIGFIAGKLKEESQARKVLYFIRNWMAALTSFVAFVFTMLLVVDVFNGEGGEAFVTNWFWNIGDKPFAAGFGVLVDPLTVMIAAFASGIGCLIMIYGVNYMKDDKHLDRYWFLMQMFIGGMVFLVMSNNFLQSFVGWEIVGFCSYALIGYFFDKKGPQDPKEFTLKEETEGDYNSHAGLKAFITTRIGDVMLLTGILIVFAVAGTFRYTELLADTTWISDLHDKKILVLTAILIFGGPIGKSAQFPLQFWLPEAMAGPTTVSALIHAAAMVKAGVYMVVRTYPMWYLGLHDLNIENLEIYFIFVAAIGGFTALMAATMGTSATELKKVLAFSTVSQLGYMFMGLGVGGLIEPHEGVMAYNGYFAGSFHMLSHAIFKALLFLSAGAIIHAVHTKYIDEMGGLRKDMPKIFWPMLIGGLSLSGLPPLGGFFSKESIFGACWELGVEGNPIGWIFLVIGALAAALTFYYTIRFLTHTFGGEKTEHVKHAEKEQGGHLHKASPLLWVPLVILAVGTIVIGWLAPVVELFMSKNDWFANATNFVVEDYHIHYGHFLQHTFLNWTTLITLGILLAGGLPAYFFYVRKSVDTNAILKKNKFVNAIYTFFYKRWYMNHAIYWCLRKFKIACEWLYENFDLKVIDRSNYLIASGTMKSGEAFRKTHTGILSVNFLYMLLGGIILIALLLFIPF